MLNEIRYVKLPPIYLKRLAEFVIVISNRTFSFMYSLLRSLFGIQLRTVGVLINILAGGMRTLVKYFQLRVCYSSCYI